MGEQVVAAGTDALKLNKMVEGKAEGVLDNGEVIVGDMFSGKKAGEVKV